MKQIIRSMLVLIPLALFIHTAYCGDLILNGLSVIPHVQSHEMKYRQEADFSLGARVQVYLRNSSQETVSLDAGSMIRLRNETPQQLLEKGEWSWHDLPSAYENHPLELPLQALTVWSWNGNDAQWGEGTKVDLSIQNHFEDTIQIQTPDVYLSSVTFTGEDPTPNAMIFHITNDSASEISLESCRLWLPKSNAEWRTLYAQSWFEDRKTFPENGMIPAKEKGIAIVKTGELPLTYTALELRVKDGQGNQTSIWAHLRIKREVFDISGGWVASNINGKNSLTFEPYLKTLKRMHINTGHIADVPGYTDNPKLYEKYPLKYFNKLDNFERYDTEEMLPRIHAVEFLGEPQYGGGTPVPPMDVWKALVPYQSTRLPTSVTHSEERIWRFYAGLSDYPHYDAYRVTAPSADQWSKYDRWDGERIRWAAPLETIGVMTRSLRDLNRPMPIAYWSQGAHHDWGHYGGRERTSPTPDELRAQAYHALAARITSLYWFNLSLKSIVKFPDLIQPITEIGREMKMLEDFFILGDSYHYERIREDNSPRWDVSVINAPHGALLFALDLDYKADLDHKVFRFQDSRKASIAFPLPPYLHEPKRVLRVSANGVEPIAFQITDEGIEVEQAFNPFNILVVTHDPEMRDKLESKRQTLIEYENSFDFDPANDPDDLAALREQLQ